MIMRCYYDKNIIKVVTGIKRSGKSVLIKQIIDELESNRILSN